MKWTLTFISLFSVINVFAADSYSCFPENDLYLPEASQKNFVMKSIVESGVSELDFYHVIESFEAFWKPIVENKYQKKLIIRGQWSDASVDAYATRDDENNPIIVVLGGLARHKDMTMNGLMLILCHELGHHYGGAPKSFRGRSKLRSWSSAEGQADYFAANKCMSKMIESNVIFTDSMTSSAKSYESSCTDKYCHKVLPAALSVGKLFASTKQDWREPSVKLKSKYKVYRTNHKHPEPQCRFDTFMAGSLCSSEFDTDFDNQDHRIGACLSDQNPEGARPNCWFTSSDY